MKQALRCCCPSHKDKCRSVEPPQRKRTQLDDRGNITATMAWQFSLDPEQTANPAHYGALAPPNFPNPLIHAWILVEQVAIPYHDGPDAFPSRFNCPAYP